LTISESPPDIRLAEEIADLRALLEGTPAALREQGLFAAYESRLGALQEELLSLRLASLVSKQQRKTGSSHRFSDEIPTNPAGDVGRLSQVTEAVDSLRRKRHRRIVSYGSAFWVLDWTLVAGGIGLLASEMRSLQPVMEHLAVIGALMAFLALGQMFVRQSERTITEADHQLELLRNQLEVLGTMYRSKQTPVSQVYERTLKMLDEAGIT